MCQYKFVIMKDCLKCVECLMLFRVSNVIPIILSESGDNDVCTFLPLCGKHLSLQNIQNLLKSYLFCDSFSDCPRWK